MPYLKGEEALPPELLSEIQNHVQGVLVYIPIRGRERSGWGRRNGTREALDRRDAAIREAVSRGVPVDRIADEYALSPDAIRKVLYRQRKSAQRA
jgi:hypothetical protein